MIFFSMATSFTAAALGAEGLAVRHHDADRQRLHTGPRRVRLRPAASLGRGARPVHPASGSRGEPPGDHHPLRADTSTAPPIRSPPPWWSRTTSSPGWARTGPRDVHADGVDAVVELDGASRHPGLRRRARAHHLHRAAPLRSRPLRHRLPRRGAATGWRPRQAACAAGWSSGTGGTRPAGPRSVRHAVTRSTGPRYGGVVYLSRVDVHSCVASSALLAHRPEVSEASGLREPTAGCRSRRTTSSAGSPSTRCTPASATQAPAGLPAARGVARASAWSTSSAGRTSPAPTTSPTCSPPSAQSPAWRSSGTGARAAGRTSPSRSARAVLPVTTSSTVRSAHALPSCASAYADADTRGAAYPDAAHDPRPRRRLLEAGVQAGLPRHRRRSHGRRGRRLRGGCRAGRRRRRAGGPAPARARRDGRRGGLGRSLSGSVSSPACSRCSTPCGAVRSGMYAERLGAERAATLNPFATHADAGIPSGVRFGRPRHPAGSLGGGPGCRPPPPAGPAAHRACRLHRAHPRWLARSRPARGRAGARGAGDAGHLAVRRPRRRDAGQPGGRVVDRPAGGCARAAVARAGHCQTRCACGPSSRVVPSTPNSDQPTTGRTT